MSNYNYTIIDGLKEKGWDESQIVDVTILQRSMGTISLIGSMYVIQDVLRNEQKRNHTFHRLMVGLSTSDILSSFFVHILSTAPIPKGYHMFSVGNVATCDAQGFINTLCFYVTTLCNCSLTTYYLVQLKYNWINKRIKALEKWLHIVPWSTGLSIAIAGLVFKVYGPLGFSCLTTPFEYPIECTDPDSSVECIRGINPSASMLFGAALLGILFLAMCYISVTMFMIYKSLSTIEKQARRYSFARFRTQANDRKRSRRVMLQGILYSLVLFLTFIFVILEMFNNGTSYVLTILQFTFWPLQGFFNALIYSIPVFQRMYNRWKDERRERQMIELKLIEENDECYESSNILSNVSKIELEQVATPSEFGSSNKMSSMLPNNNSIKENDSRIIHNNHHNESVLIVDETIKEERGNKGFEGEEEKEEIQKSNERSINHSGLGIRDNQLKRNVEFNIVNSIECDEEEIKEATQDGSTHVFAHHSDIDMSNQSEESVEGGVNSDADESNYNEDNIDDYLALSAMSR